MIPYVIGTRVRIVGGREGVVTVVHGQTSPPSYQIFLDAQSTPLVSHLDLEPIETIDSDLGSLLRGGVFAPLTEFQFAVTLRKLDDMLTDTLYSYNAARIQIQAHQFKPLLKLLDSPHRRMLIADEVGLGKTIEAGIILSELDLRERIDRAVVVCPHALLRKWRDELDSKFGMRFEIWSGSQLRAWLEEAKATGAAQPVRCIVSLEGLRTDATVELLQEAPVSIDLLIVDEAHHLRNSATQSFALGEALTGVADVVLFLTATPLNLHNRDLFNLVHLLLPEVYGNEETFEAQVVPNQALNAAIRILRGAASNVDIHEEVVKVYESELSQAYLSSDRLNAMLMRLQQPDALTREERVRYQRLCTDLNTLDGVLSRTRKSDVAAFAVREPHSVRLAFTDAERAFYEAVTAYCMERYADTGGSGFGATTYQRQVCSCIPAMREMLRDVRNGADPSSGEEDEGDEEDIALRSYGETARSGSSVEEQRLLDEAITAAQAIGDVDTKFQRFEEVVHTLVDIKGAERVMVFSFFRRTIRYLERRLSGRYKVGVIMGGMSLDERASVVERFRAGELQVLLSTEVGGEGLDFQFCNVLFNYDLPWNPMRVEQRIGRLDRYGQKHEKILIYNLLVQDTVEDRIFGRLFERIELFKAAIGDLESILGDTVATLTRAAMDFHLTPQQQMDKTEILAQQLINRKSIEAQVAAGQGVLLSNEQFMLDRFSAIQRGRAYVTARELMNFCKQALAQHFPGTVITESNGRFWIRPDIAFANYVENEIYEMGADGHLHQTVHVLRPLIRLRDAAVARTAVPITCTSDEGFGERQLELLSPQHPYVQAIVRRCRNLPMNRLSVARVRLPATDTMPAGQYALVLFKLQSTGSPAMRRIEAILVSVSSLVPARQEPEWLGRQLEVMAEGPVTGGLVVSSAVDACLVAAEQLLLDVVASERMEIESRHADLTQMRIASLEFAFARKKERLESNIATVANAQIKRMKRSQLDSALARHQQKVAELRSQERVAITFERAGAAIVDVT